jgi:hypothetical protein
MRSAAQKQRMDERYAARFAADKAKYRRSQPCKDEQSVVDYHDGSCLRCGAAQGEACLEKHLIVKQ